MGLTGVSPYKLTEKDKFCVQYQPWKALNKALKSHKKNQKIVWHLVLNIN